ncbi:MAG: enterotoxin A family protein [Terricaulis sp.]
MKPVPGGAAIEEDEIIVTGHRSRGILGWFADRLGDLADMAGLNGVGGQYRTAAGYNPTFNALASTGAVLNEQQGQVQTWVAEHPRVMGAVQMVGGGLQLTTAVVSGGAAVLTSETGVGAVAFGSLAVVAGTNGADNFQAGWRTWWSGVPTETYTHAALRSTGLSNTQASIGEAVIGIGSGFGIAAAGREGLEQLAVAGAQRNAARAWATRPELELVYRGERSSLPPEVVFQNGFAPRGDNLDLLAHVTRPASDSAYVATSLDFDIALDFAGRNGYVYQIAPKGGVNVNSALGVASPFPEQLEVAIPWGVHPTSVRGAYSLSQGALTGEYVLNPWYIE